MSVMTEQFAADVASVESELPVSFTFRGREYTGQKNATTDSQQMADAGLVQMFDYELLWRTAAMPVPAPAKNEQVQIGAIRYRIDKLSPSQDGVVTTLYCTQDN